MKLGCVYGVYLISLSQENTVGTKEFFMGRNYKRCVGKIIAASVLVFVGITAILSTSIAGLSSIYTWDSGQGEVGSFDFQNKTTYMNLFPEEDLIYPGDSGSAVFSLPNFAGFTPVWSVSETNESNIPVVIYIGNVYYSKYNFEDSTYIKIADGSYVSCADISNDKTTLLTEVQDGAEINWIWPSKLYELSGESYVESASAAATEYTAHNTALCSAVYSFDEAFANALSSITVDGFAHAPKAYVTSNETDETQTVLMINTTTPINSDNKITCTNGLYYANGTAITLMQNGAAVTPTAETTISKDDYYAFLVTDSGTLTIFTFMSGLGDDYADRYRVSVKAYGISATDTENEYTLTNENPRFRIVKVYPTADGNRATISLKFSAVVSTD